MLLSKKYFFVILILSTFFFAKSSLFAKKLISHPPSLSAFTGQGQNQLIQLKLMPKLIASKDQEIVPLTAYVSVPFDFPGELNYQWILTENVILNQGELSAQLKNLEKNKIYPIEIKVSGFSTQENRQVVFKISGSLNGHKISADGIIASKKEDTFEDVVKNVEKIKAENN